MTNRKTGTFAIDTAFATATSKGHEVEILEVKQHSCGVNYRVRGPFKNDNYGYNVKSTSLVDA